MVIVIVIVPVFPLTELKVKTSRLAIMSDVSSVTLLTFVIPPCWGLYDEDEPSGRAGVNSRPCRVAGSHVPLPPDTVGPAGGGTGLRWQHQDHQKPRQLPTRYRQNLPGRLGRIRGDAADDRSTPDPFPATHRGAAHR